MMGPKGLRELADQVEGGEIQPFERQTISRALRLLADQEERRDAELQELRRTVEDLQAASHRAERRAMDKENRFIY